jgi:hypothetical protein
MKKQTENKITKIIGELEKASKTHKSQAERLGMILSVLKGANKSG